jgi:hypothetical protein
LSKCSGAAKFATGNGRELSIIKKQVSRRSLQWRIPDGAAGERHSRTRRLTMSRRARTIFGVMLLVVALFATPSRAQVVASPFAFGGSPFAFGGSPFAFGAGLYGGLGAGFPAWGYGGLGYGFGSGFPGFGNGFGFPGYGYGFPAYGFGFGFPAYGYGYGFGLLGNPVGYGAFGYPVIPPGNFNPYFGVGTTPLAVQSALMERYTFGRGSLVSRGAPTVNDTSGVSTQRFEFYRSP